MNIMYVFIRGWKLGLFTAVLGQLTFVCINWFVYFSDGFVSTFDLSEMETKDYIFASFMLVLKL